MSYSRACYVNENWNWSGSQKIQGAGFLVQRRQLLDEENSELPRKRQCELLSLHRSGTYYKPRAKADETPIEKALNELYIKDPCLGLRKLPDMVGRHYGIRIGAKNCTHTQGYEDKNHLPTSQNECAGKTHRRTAALSAQIAAND